MAHLGIWRRCAWELLIAAACLTMGQGCGNPAPPSSNVPLASLCGLQGMYCFLDSACGLNAASCVEVVGKGPIAIAAGDFNGDGRPDVVAANSRTDNIEMLFNNGGGVLVSGGRYMVGDSPGAIVAADFNGDGKLDLAASDGLGIAILINHGDGTFDPAVHVALDRTINAVPVSVTAADFNGDGAIDLAASATGRTFDSQAVTSANADNVGILLNDGAGHFSLASTIIIDNPFPRLGDITAGDVDGDGRPDLVVTQSSGQVTVLLNQGGGEFINSFSVLVGENHILNDVKLADLDGDARLDLIVADSGDSPVSSNQGGDVAIFHNRGGAFDPPMFIATGLAPISIAVADYTGDGLSDLAVANNLSNDVAILLSQGAGTFGAPIRFEIGEGPTSIVAADFDGNGTLDLAVSHRVSGLVGFHLNDGAGCFMCGP